MDKKAILRIIIIILAISIVLIAIIISTLSNLNSNQFSNDRANLVVDNTNNENNVEKQEDVQEIQEEQAHTDSIVIRNLVNNDWSRIGYDFSGDYEKDENGNYVYEGFTLYSNDGVNVRNVIFNQNYEDEVIANLYVGATYDEIVEAFGIEPTFENEELNFYGYKTTTVYAFFYEDEISIYPNSYFNNTEFENILFEYLSGFYDGDQTNFVVEIRNNFQDFSAELDDEDVVLTSENRQIQIRLNGNYAQTEVTIYNGYREGNSMEEYKETYNITEEKTVDLVEQVEIERITSN